jgi:hypothetical protein
MVGEGLNLLTPRCSAKRTFFSGGLPLDLMVSCCGLAPRDRRSTLRKILAGIRRTAARVRHIAKLHIQNGYRRRLLALNT